MRRKLVIRLIFFVLLANYSSAVADTAICDQLYKAKDVLKCVLEQHPDLQKARILEAQSKQLESVAGQRVNPELNSKGLYGRAENENVINFEVSLAHTFELGGKRGARIARANVQSELASIDLIKSEEEVYLNTLFSLYRLRQIQSQIEILNDSLETFSRVLKQFRMRARLTPEQEVSFGVIQLAYGDSQLKKSTLMLEEIQLTKSLEFATGRPLVNKISKLLPEKKTAWPNLTSNQVQAEIPPYDSRIRLANANLSMAKTQFEVSKSESWPDVKFGPAFQTQTQGVFNYSSFGATLTMPIPIFHANGAGRAYSVSGVNVAEINSDLINRELTYERDIVLQKYNMAVQTLKNLPTTFEIERKHNEMEALFSRGVIPSPLFIEAHRQRFEFSKSRDEHELAAVEALWKFYKLDGKMFQEEI